MSAASVREHLNKNEQYDKTLNEIGGFGKFQCLTTTTFIIGISVGFWYFFPISFLELEPAYKCRTDPSLTTPPDAEWTGWYDCTAE
jgi:hypothetical protein